MAKCVAVLTTLIALLLAPLAGPASAAVVFNERFDLQEFVDFNTCDGELVFLTGFVHIVIKEEADGTLTFHGNGHGQGVGDQGNEYVLNFQDRATSSTDELHIKFRAVLISKGGAPNEQSQFTFDFPPGELNFAENCRG
jgi:hypothetical protein